MEYRTMKEVKERPGEFIEQVYNKERLRSALGYVSPAEFEIIYKPPEWDVLTLTKICPA